MILDECFFQLQNQSKRSTYNFPDHGPPDLGSVAKFRVESYDGLFGRPAITA